jgi:putative colanic acid biosysnthesis UDP-glucose lipid carrier transferase
MIVNKNSIRIFRLLSDIILLNITFLTAASLAQSFGLLFQRNYMFILLLVLNILWYYTTRLSGFYEDFSIRYFAYQFINIIKSTLWQVIAAILFIFFTKEDLFTRNFILYYAFILLFLISLRTVIFKSLLQYLRDKGINVRNLVIIGGGEIGTNFYNLIREHPDFGYNFTGFISPSSDEVNSPGVIGQIPDLENILVSEKVEEAVIAFKENDPVLLNDIINICNKQAVRVHIIPDYFRFLSNKFGVSMIGNYPVISVRSEPLEEAAWRFIKRTFDISFSLFVTIFILSWLFPLIAILIKIDSRGKVMYKQERIGEKNRKIKVYKFRSLHENRDDKFIPVVDNDPRITRVGKFLRKSNLDELPQFINVIKGDMSVVGPRPHALSFNETYSEMINEIKMRHNVKPGITGWAQIHGLRGDVADPVENRVRTRKRIQFDLWYIENWTFWLDVQIILITVWQMIKGKTKGK